MRLSGALRRLAVIAATSGALTVGGCSFPLASLTSKPDAPAEHTAAVVPPGQSDAATGASLPSEVDLAYARAAAAEAMTRGGKDNSVPWKNPQTGAGGNITLLTSSAGEAGLPCRDFLASYVRGGSQSWLHGSACRSSRGEWEVKNLKPLQAG